MRIWSEEDKRKFGLAQKGNKHNLGKKLSNETKAKISAAHKGVPSIAKSLSKMGVNNPNWRGGVSPILKRLRQSAKFKRWRHAVFKRDNYTCQSCGKRGGELHPDHIKQFAYYPKLRFVLSNGRTLCKSCHQKTDTWGFKPMNTKVEKHKLPTEQK